MSALSAGAAPQRPGLVVLSVCFSISLLSSAERARVGLTTLPGMKGTDYINASYVMVQYFIRAPLFFFSRTI